MVQMANTLALHAGVPSSILGRSTTNNKEEKKKLMREVLTGKLESHKEIFRGKRKESKLIKRIKRFILNKKRKNA